MPAPKPAAPPQLTEPQLAEAAKCVSTYLRE